MNKRAFWVGVVVGAIASNIIMQFVGRRVLRKMIDNEVSSILSEADDA